MSKKLKIVYDVIKGFVLAGIVYMPLIIIFLVVCIAGLRERNTNLEYQINSLCDYIELENCFGCDTAVEVSCDENDLYYIECSTCHVRSGFYKVAVEAIENWNDLCKD